MINKRQYAIVEFIRSKGIAYVSELSEQFGISDVTIRRDLNYLEKNKLIERFHGGACLCQEADFDLPNYMQRSQSHLPQKDLVAKRAEQLIDDGDTIFISSSSTALHVIDYLQNKRIRVITNNALAVTKNLDPNIELILTGGEHSFRRQSLFGEFAISAINRTKANKALIGVTGICVEHGITSTHYLESTINSYMLKQCTGKRIIVADGSKVGRSSGFVCADVDAVDILVTDESADAKELEALRKSGVEVILAK